MEWARSTHRRSGEELAAARELVKKLETELYHGPDRRPLFAAAARNGAPPGGGREPEPGISKNRFLEIPPAPAASASGDAPAAAIPDPGRPRRDRRRPPPGPAGAGDTSREAAQAARDECIRQAGGAAGSVA